MADPAGNGWSAQEVFASAQAGYAYDDLLFMPGHASFEASAVDVGTRLTRNVELHAPVLAGAAATTTEAEMAIAAALVGGMGIIHASQSVASQVAMVKRVKRHASGFIVEPFALGPARTLEDLDRLRAEQGVSSVPITDTGGLGGKLIGWVGEREADTYDDRRVRLKSVMVQDIATGVEPLSYKEAVEQMRRAKVGKLPIVDAEGRLVSLVSRSDVKKLAAFPLMSRGPGGQLLVGAAVAAGRQGDADRAAALAEAGADVLLLDGAEASGERPLELLRALKASHPRVEMIVGPVSTCREAKRMVDAGADAVVVGCAAPPGGEVCGVLAAVGRPEATALFEVSRYVRLNYGVPVVAGPRLCNGGHILKALCLGASAVMIDEMLSGADEAPGQAHRGEECLRAAPGGVLHSVSHVVANKGSAGALIRHLVQGVRNGLQDLGYGSIGDLHKALDLGELRMECRSVFASRLWEAGAQALRKAAHPEVMPVFVSARAGLQ